MLIIRSVLGLAVVCLE